MTETLKQVALIIIGAEILTAKVQDQNSPWLVKILRARGLKISEIRVIDDDIDIIIDTLNDLRKKNDWVITTGGIGPTHDDKTVEAVAKTFDLKLTQDDYLREKLREYYGDDIRPGMQKLTLIPEGAKVHLASNRFIPCYELENVYILPGVPSLVHHCIAALPQLRGDVTFFSGALFLDLAESEIAQNLEDLQNQNTDVAIGSYPLFGEERKARVKITVDGDDESRVNKVFNDLGAILGIKNVRFSEKPSTAK